LPADAVLCQVVVCIDRTEDRGIYQLIDRERGLARVYSLGRFRKRKLDFGRINRGPWDDQTQERDYADDADNSDDARNPRDGTRRPDCLGELMETLPLRNRRGLLVFVHAPQSSLIYFPERDPPQGARCSSAVNKRWQDEFY